MHKLFSLAALLSLLFPANAYALSPSSYLQLQPNYVVGMPIEIKVHNPTAAPLTFNEAGQCHRFFKVFDRNNNQISISDPLALCTLEFRSITVAANETKVLDTWNQKLHTYCPPNAACFAPPELQVAPGPYTIEVYPADQAAVRQIITIGTVPFSDVPASYWAANYIYDLYQREIVQGYSNGSFGPENNITRAEVVKIALLSARSKELSMTAKTIESNFRDVPRSHSLATYIYDAAAQGIIPRSTYFYPDKPATRFECLQILMNAFQLQDQIEDFMIQDRAESSNFSDTTRANMAPYAAYAREQGIVSGLNNNFYPNEPVRRSEIAKIASNLLK